MKTLLRLALPSLVAAACTSTDAPPAREEAVPAAHVAASPPPSPPPPQHPGCARSVPNIKVALHRATAAMRAAGFMDYPFKDDWYELSPALPNAWPPRDCALVFYVFHITRHDRIGSKYDIFDIESADLKIELDLRSGEVSSSRLPGIRPPGGSYLCWGPFSDFYEAAMFDAVDYSRIPEQLHSLIRYTDWLLMDDPAFFVWLWHGDFLEWVTQSNPEIRERIRRRARAIMAGRAKFYRQPTAGIP